MKKDALKQILKDTSHIFSALPDDLVLQTARCALPALLDDEKISTNEIVELVLAYRSEHPVNKIRKIFKRHCVEAAAELEND